MSLQWQGADDMIRRLQEYNNRIVWAVKQVALYFQAVFEEYARREAKWQDRTGNARAGLHSYITELSQDTVRLWLSHSVHYGLFLEVRWAGRFGIIWETIQRHLEPIRQMLQGVFG